MSANTAPAPIVLEPTLSQPHNPLSTHCRQLTTHTPPMPAIPSQNPKHTQQNTILTKPSLTSSKSQSKNTPTKSTKTCEGCSQPHDGSYGSGRFCSVHCARRIAASRKWEKQRSQRKRAAAAAAAAVVTTPVDHSTSSLSSTSSDDRVTQKRQRVVVMQGIIPASHVVHPNLVHPQPQHFQRSLAFSGIPPHPYSAAASPLSGTPTPPPQSTHHPLTAYMEYSSLTPRTLTPVQYHSAYYPYHSNPVPYTSTPPPYALYPSPSPHHIPPPPPPTPSREVLNGKNTPITASYSPNAPTPAASNHRPVQQGLVSSERECEAVAEALLTLRTSNKTD